MAQQLKPKQLRSTFDCSTIQCDTTAEMVRETTIIGQERGVQAIEFGINLKSPGYNIFVTGESGTGRTTAIQRFVEQRATSDPVPDDWLYVHNYVTSHKPIAIRVPAGRGCPLRSEMEQLVSQLRRELPQAFDNESFRDAAMEIQHQREQNYEALLRGIQAKAVTMNAVLIPSPEGFRILPGINGQPLNQDQIADMSDESKERWKKTLQELQRELSDFMFAARGLDAEASKKVKGLVERVGRTVIDVAMARVRELYADLTQLNDFFAAIEADIVDNIRHFRPEGSESDDESVPTVWFRRYQVNVIIDNQEHKHAPVVAEYDPQLSRLVGRVEHEARYGGAVVTDFTLLRAGALHTANGGYLVLRARDLFAEPGAYESLKRAIVGRMLRPDDPAIRGGAATRSLDPDPIPLDVKVILIGPPSLYYLLLQNDEDFSSIFKVMADFDFEVERNPENELDYAHFIGRLCHDEKLHHLDADAVGQVIEYGSRLAGTQNRLSTRFGQLADLVREANYYTNQDGRTVATRADVKLAIANRRYLRNRVEMRMLEMLLDGKRLIATDGDKVGQINALTVSQIGEHAFGQPSRVTVRTYVGKSGVVQIDREVELAGPIHNKGLMTLVGYLGGQYASDHPLSLNAQITFEQNYGGVDGDSASSTELYALLSSLSDIPIKQTIAVTGSINQHGEIQPIGGVTHKIEGWFKVCESRGLTGTQGCMIPATNVGDLMLDSAVIEAVEAGQFHIWSVATADEGIELLTGRSASDVHKAVASQLSKLAETMKEYEAR